MDLKCEYCGGLGEHMGADGVPVMCGYCGGTGGQPEPDSDSARADRYATALRAIIERADNNALGSSKVQDMRKIAEQALEG